MRTSENVTSFPLEGWFTQNITELAKKFVTKAIPIDPKMKPDVFKNNLITQLKKFHSDENLNIIGGFQDDKQKLRLLFYKMNKRTAPPNLFAELFVTNPS